MRKDRRDRGKEREGGRKEGRKEGRDRWKMEVVVKE